MSRPYSHLTKPIRLGSTLIKSRFLYPCAQPHCLQGPELYPADPIVSYYCTLAKNGAGLIYFHDLANDYQRSTGGFDIVHFAMYNIEDKGCQNYFSHFTHMVHYYGGKLITTMNTDMVANKTVNDPKTDGGFFGLPMPPDAEQDEDALQYSFGSLVGPEGTDDSLVSLGADPRQRQMFTKESIEEYINNWIARAKLYKSLGFDGGLLEIDSFLGQFFRADYNKRTDEYGGSYENRCRFVHEFLGRARKELGKDFLLVANCPALDTGDGPVPFGPGCTWPTDTLVDFLKVVEPYIDLIHIRADLGDNMSREQASVFPGKSALCGRILKAAGVNIPIAGRSNFTDLDKLDEILAGGDLDMISANHLFMSNENLGEILKSGESDDVNPCILCHACRGTSWVGDWMSHCTINPELGIEYRKDKMIAPVTHSKKVAVIGGGPGGMKAALYLKQRGHHPVIFEKTDELGGQLKLLKTVDFKWRVEDYRKFLIHQIEKKGIEVRYNTEATPAMIEEEKFDACIAAVGAVPALPNIEGAELARWTAHSVFGHEAEVGHKVVVVGGASTAAEAAMYLVKAGHDVLQISRKNIVAYELNPIRERGNVNKKSVELGVKHKRLCNTTKIEANRVTFVDRHGVEHSVDCDDVVVSGGVTSEMDLASSFYACTPEFYMIGDCRDSGNMRKAIADAYAVSMQI